MAQFSVKIVGANKNDELKRNWTLSLLITNKKINSIKHMVRNQTDDQGILSKNLDFKMWWGISSVLAMEIPQSCTEPLENNSTITDIMMMRQDIRGNSIYNNCFNSKAIPISKRKSSCW